MDKRKQTILFVDDEPGVIESIRKLLHAEPWNLLTACSGEEGLEILKKEDVDLVISDVSMPGMGGIAFLKKLKKLYPQMVRIFLSGYSDRSSVIEALSEGSAHQLLPKPWNDDEFRDIIRSAFIQAEDLREKGKGLQKIINTITTLHSMPQTYLKMKKCLANISTVSIDSLVEVIEQDASISAALLRWSNSALFGQMQKVDSVDRALMVLGIDIVEGILLSESFFGSIMSDSKSVSGFDLKEFEVHSRACGILARMLMAKISTVSLRDTDRAFTAGLLHDLGKLAEERCLPAELKKIIDTAQLKNTLLLDAEYEVLGTTHEEIGRHLAEWWSMPSFLVNTIRWHHNPALCKADTYIINAVHLADILVQKFELGASGNFRIPDANETSLEFFDLTEEELPALKESVIYYLS
jgi:HD-like signal output (HDOD) protein